MMKDTPQGQTDVCANIKPSVFDVLLRCLPESPYREKFTAEIVKIEDTVKQQQGRIEELHQQNAMLVEFVGICVKHQHDLPDEVARYLMTHELVKTTSAQSSAWLNKKHMEWLGKPVAWYTTYADGRLKEQVALTQETADDLLAYGLFLKPVYTIPSPERKE